jgi:hypothetical protein
VENPKKKNTSNSDDYRLIAITMLTYKLLVGKTYKPRVNDLKNSVYKKKQNGLLA